SHTTLHSAVYPALSSFLSFLSLSIFFLFFFFNDPPPTEIYTLSLHDALPIFRLHAAPADDAGRRRRLACAGRLSRLGQLHRLPRSEEHTSELQSRENLVCRLLLEKKKKKKKKKKKIK